MASFTINGVEYQSKLFDGQKQIHVMKRLLPAFSALAGVATSLKDLALTADEQEPDAQGAEAGPKLSMERLSIFLAPVTRELALLSDADVDFILHACLDVTERRNAIGVGWSKVRQNGVLLDQDDGKFATRLAIAWNVISDNFQDMFASFGIDLQGLMRQAGA